MREILYANMSSQEIKACVDRRCTVVLPVGATEQHGVHLPLNVDYFSCERVVLSAARLVDSVIVLPTVTFGVSNHHLEFPGTISLRTGTFANLIVDILNSLSHHGFNKAVIVNGHGGNRGPLSTAIANFMEEKSSQLTVFWANYYGFAADEVQGVRTSGTGGMAHAGEYETSLSLYLQAAHVRMDSATKRVPHSPIPDYVYADLLGDSHVGAAVSYGCKGSGMWDYAFSPSGVAGDPTVATAEKGKAIFDLVVSDMRRFFEHLEPL